MSRSLKFSVVKPSSNLMNENRSLLFESFAKNKATISGINVASKSLATTTKSVLQAQAKSGKIQRTAFVMASLIHVVILPAWPFKDTPLDAASSRTVAQ